MDPFRYLAASCKQNLHMLLILDLDSAYRHITPRENKVLGIDEIIEK